MLVALLLALSPHATFTATCGAPLGPLQCVMDASATTTDPGVPIVKYAWDWGDTRKETHPDPIVRNTWAKAGTYTVILVVTDAAKHTSQKTLHVLVGTPPSPCPPPTHDTTVVVRTDTLVRRDTMYVGTSVCQNLVIGDPGGENNVYCNSQYLGRFLVNNTGGVDAYKYTGFSMPYLGTYATQALAILALQGP